MNPALLPEFPISYSILLFWPLRDSLIYQKYVSSDSPFLPGMPDLFSGNPLAEGLRFRFCFLLSLFRNLLPGKRAADAADAFKLMGTSLQPCSCPSGAFRLPYFPPLTGAAADPAPIYTQKLCPPHLSGGAGRYGYAQPKQRDESFSEVSPHLSHSLPCGLSLEAGGKAFGPLHPRQASHRSPRNAALRPPAISAADFKRLFGMTPGEYRRRADEDEKFEGA